MPRLDGLVHLNPDWLYGELVALALGALPAVLLGRWTVRRSHLRGRVILQLMGLAAVPALSAVTEFVVRGRGTPYPWDPPGELVTTGPYAYRVEPATLYLSESCSICRQTRDLIESTKPVGLVLRPAERCTVAGLRRALYVGLDGLQASGLAAIARALEHSGPGWAYLAWLVRLPVVRPLLQLLVDGMGGGPRQLPTMKET